MLNEKMAENKENNQNNVKTKIPIQKMVTSELAFDSFENSLDDSVFKGKAEFVSKEVFLLELFLLFKVFCLSEIFSVKKRFSNIQ